MQVLRLSLALAAVAAALVAAAPAAAKDAALQAAIASPDRSPDSAARDAYRHPAESLTFWGLAPRRTVIEISPGGGYWTEILAPYAKATGGRYIAAVADTDNPQASEAARKGRAAFEARYADAAKWGTIEYVGFGAQSKALGPAGSADLVITARNVHNWMMAGYQDKAFADFYAVLKPGGILAVEDHRSDPRPAVEGFKDGYIPTASVVAAAEKAGFNLAAKSEINANPKDTKDHPFGVWTLPPIKRTSPMGQAADPSFDRAKYDAIGESDRMTLRFVKPG